MDREPPAAPSCLTAVFGRKRLEIREQYPILLHEMAALSFEWDPKKASSNEKKHGVTFDEAQTVFYDEDALVIPDPDHSAVEERFVILGLSSQDRALIVVHCLRAEGASIRIISARKAGTKEQKPYWERKS